MKEKSCAFTGHRPHRFPWRYNEADSRCAALKATLTRQIAALAEGGVTDYYCGGADGTDCWAALAVFALREENPGLRLHCILPHEGQADRWNSAARERYNLVLEQADSVEYVSRSYYKGCMLDRNRRLVESAGLLLAVYRGTQQSGTGATVNYARKLGREIITIDPISLQIAHENGLPFVHPDREGEIGGPLP